MSSLPIEPYLIELLERTDAEGFPLVIAGGLGIYLKRRHVTQERRSPTVIATLPEARVTADIDAFMRIEVFLRDKSRGVAPLRALLEDLGYRVHERARNFQFVQPIDEARAVKIDLHSRLPEGDEALQIKVAEPRVGRSGSMAFRTLQAYATPEAFAIDHGVQALPIAGTSPRGDRSQGTVRVPHPFASLCMKLKAAQDHERAAVKKARGEKHAFDVYLLVAMLDEIEFEQARTYAREFARASEMRSISAAVTELFASPSHPGSRTILAQARLDRPFDLDLERFSSLLRELFDPAIAHHTP